MCGLQGRGGLETGWKHAWRQAPSKPRGNRPEPAGHPTSTGQGLGLPGPSEGKVQRHMCRKQLPRSSEASSRVLVGCVSRYVCEQVGVSGRVRGEGCTQAPRTFFSYTSCHTMLAKKRCCMISLASSEPPPSLRGDGGHGDGVATCGAQGSDPSSHRLRSAARQQPGQLQGAGWAGAAGRAGSSQAGVSRPSARASPSRGHHTWPPARSFPGGFGGQPRAGLTAAWGPS